MKIILEGGIVHGINILPPPSVNIDTSKSIYDQMVNYNPKEDKDE